MILWFVTKFRVSVSPFYVFSRRYTTALTQSGCIFVTQKYRFSDKKIGKCKLPNNLQLFSCSILCRIMWYTSKRESTKMCTRLLLFFKWSIRNLLWYADTTEVCTCARIIRCTTKRTATTQSSSPRKKQSVSSLCRSPRTTTAPLRSLQTFLVHLVTFLATVGYIDEVENSIGCTNALS